jgi:hypothetical protein
MKTIIPVMTDPSGEKGLPHAPSCEWSSRIDIGFFPFHTEMIAISPAMTLIKVKWLTERGVPPVKMQKQRDRPLWRRNITSMLPPPAETVSISIQNAPLAGAFCLRHQIDG